MAVTTYAAIRDNAIDLLKVVQPTSQSGVYFQPAPDDQDFREWCVANPKACFRRFTVRNGLNYQPVEVTNADIVAERMSSSVEVAYPPEWGKYGRANRRDMEDVIDEDRATIHATISSIGGQDDFVDGQSLCLSTGDHVDQEGGIYFLVLNYEVAFYRAV